MAYRIARSLAQLRQEADQSAPRRSKRSDGWIGDAAHATRSSDHNPWVVDGDGVGVVRALDVTHDPDGGMDARALAECVRVQAASGHPAMGDGAYVISNREIASVKSSPPWAWRPYDGSNPHTGHCHVSVGRTAASYDSTRVWGVQAAASWGERYTGEPGSRVIARWAVGTDVEHLQAFLSLGADGYFGEGTEAGVKIYQAAQGLTADGIVGPVTWAKVLAPPPPPPEPEPTWQEPVQAEPGERSIGAFSVGPDVAWLQTRLGLTADGEFGPGTETAVRGFQAAQGVTADGIVGPMTWGRLQLVVLAAGNDVDRRITDGRLAEHHDPGHIKILHVEAAIALAAAGTVVITVGGPAATALPGVTALAGRTRGGTGALLDEYLAGSA